MGKYVEYNGISLGDEVVVYTMGKLYKGKATRINRMSVRVEYEEREGVFYMGNFSDGKVILIKKGE